MIVIVNAIAQIATIKQLLIIQELESQEHLESTVKIKNIIAKVIAVVIIVDI